MHLISRESTSSCRTSPKGTPKNSLRKKPCKLLTGTYKMKAPGSSAGEELLLPSKKKPQETLCTNSSRSQTDTSQTC